MIQAIDVRKMASSKRHCTSNKTYDKIWERPVGYYGEYERKRRDKVVRTPLE